MSDPDTALVLAGNEGARLIRAPSGQPFRCAVGKAGIVPAVQKMEGDGATPAATLALRRVLFRADRLAPPRAAVPVEPIGPHDGWCDSPYDADYNRMVRLPHGTSHERLWRDDPLYDVIGVLGWNDSPVARQRGSAIFLHVCRPDYAPTEGCVALVLSDLLAILPGLRAIEVRAS